MNYLNPYIAGNPIASEFGFFGREDVIRSAKRYFSTPGQDVVVFFGQRRIGKTSVLLQLQRRLNHSQFVVVYQDLMDKATRPLGEVVRDLARSIALEVGTDEPMLEFDDDGSNFQHVFLPLVYEALPTQNHRLVILFDEFDVLDILEREKLPEKAAANCLFKTLRRWIIEEHRLKFGLSMGRDPKDLENRDFLATVKNAPTIPISILSQHSTHQLITTPIESIRYSEDAVEYIYHLTNGHPYFTQLICQIVYDASYDLPKDTEKDGIPLVQKSLVKMVVPQVFQTGNNVFAWIWDGLPPAERIVASAIAQILPDDSKTVDWKEISDALQDHRLRIITEELEAAPRLLIEWNLLQRNNGGYRFVVPILRNWIQEYKPFSRVKDEIDRINPRADRYYQLGIEEYNDNNLPDAIENFDRALNLNPEHLRAWLSLAEVHLDTGSFDQAVDAYEEAYKRDEVRSRAGLVKALFARASKQVIEINAIADLQRILEIQPNNREANKRKLEFEVQLKQSINQLISEIKDASNLKDYKKLRKLFSEYKKKDPKRQDPNHSDLELLEKIAQLHLEAQEFESSFKWKAALETYDHISELNPEDKSISELKEGVERGRKSILLKASLVFMTTTISLAFIGYLLGRDMINPLISKEFEPLAIPIFSAFLFAAAPGIGLIFTKKYFLENMSSLTNITEFLTKTLKPALPIVVVSSASAFSIAAIVDLITGEFGSIVLAILSIILCSTFVSLSLITFIRYLREVREK